MIQPTDPDAPALVLIFDITDAVKLIRDFIRQDQHLFTASARAVELHKLGQDEFVSVPEDESFIDYCLIRSVSFIWTMVLDADQDDEEARISNVDLMFRQELYTKIEDDLNELMTVIRPSHDQLLNFVGPWNEEGREYACSAYYMRRKNSMYLISLKDQFDEGFNAKLEELKFVIDQIKPQPVPSDDGTVTSILDADEPGAPPF